MVQLPAPLGGHPVVVVSPQSVIDANGIPSVNGLLCSTIRGGDNLGQREVELIVPDDGVRQRTGCQCHAMLLIPKRLFDPAWQLGSVQAVRRTAITQMLRAIFEL